MNTWRMYLQFNGPEQSIFNNVDFAVSDELYEQIQQALKAGKPLKDCEFYKGLENAGLSAIDITDYLDVTDLELDKPEREDYDEGEEGEQEYKDAMEEYESGIEDRYDQFALEDWSINDPGDFDRFKANFIGRTCEDRAGDEETSESFDFNSECPSCVYYSLTVDFDADGTITDVTVDSAEGLEWEGLRNSGFSDAYPDYDFLTEELEEELGLAEEDE